VKKLLRKLYYTLHPRYRKFATGIWIKDTKEICNCGSFGMRPHGWHFVYLERPQ
jgi:hypothetical protein